MSLKNLTTGPHYATCGGFYGPRGDNNEIIETEIIWINPDEEIPEGYKPIPDAHKEYLGAWLIYLLNGNIPKTEGYYFNDQKIISAMANGPNIGPDQKPYWLWIKIDLGNEVSKTYIDEDSLHEAIGYHKDRTSISYKRNELNSIVSRVKDLKPGEYRLLCINDYCTVKNILN